MHLAALKATRDWSAEFLPLAAERSRLLGLAWLTDVGHKRPDTPVGKPLAQAIREVKPLEARLRELAKPVSLDVRIVREL